jgi:hypothetical protein
MLTLENVCDRLILCTIMLAIIYTVMCSLGDVFTVRSVTPVHCLILLNRDDIVGRFVDDLLAIDVDILRDRLYVDGPLRGIYRRGSLQLEETGAGTTVNYMDVTLTRDPTVGIATDVYDKRCEPGFQQIRMIRFPHIQSFIADCAKYNIVTSQFIRFMRLCSSREAFVHRLSDLLAALSLKSYSMPRLYWKVRKLIFAHPDMYAIGSPAWFFGCIKRRTEETLRDNPPPF